MTTATPSLRRLTPQAAVLLLAAVAWLATVGRAQAMRAVTGTAGLGLAGFTTRYLLAWAGAGIPAFFLTALAGRLGRGHPMWATAAAVAVFAACGVYQLTPLKSRCLRHCRSPLLHSGVRTHP